MAPLVLIEYDFPMNTFFKGIAIFFVLLVATSIMMDTLQTEFGNTNFWDKHGVFFLIFITFFPRLTLLFSSVATGGFFWWLGFLFVPRVLVAALATVSYFHTNPVLVIISWLVAIGGETAEKAGLRGRKRFVFRTFSTGPVRNEEDASIPEQPSIRKDDAIEAEFTKKS